MKLSPKFTRNLHRIIPFGLIWLVTGSVLLLAEMAATQNQNLNPSSAITITWPVLVFASIAVTLVGLLVGLIELVVLEKRFRAYSLGAKIFYKFLIYVSFLLLINFITFPVAASIESNIGLIDSRVWEKTGDYFTSITFLSTLVQMSFSLLLSLLYAAISENLGHQVLYNFFTGKYHKPKREQRIFMFLDMKSSTTIAEQLGHVQYFELLQKYYDAMSDAIIDSWGEVYQYIGDEVVISWNERQGVENANCMKCFFSIKEHMRSKHDSFVEKFGVYPDFKAGMHLGEVTTGEVGALKKEIVFTGDVLNTTARIQSLCKEYQRDLILSEDLVEKVREKNGLLFEKLGETSLRGKEMTVSLYSAKLSTRIPKEP